MSKTGKINKSKVCQGCLSSERRLSPIGVQTGLLCRILGDDSRLARTARNNLSKPKQRLCWECNQTLLNVYKFQQRVLQAQSTLHLVGKQITQEDALSRLKVTLKDSFDFIENYIENIEHYPFKAEIIDNDVTEGQIEIDFQDNSTEIKAEEEKNNILEGNLEAEDTPKAEDNPNAEETSDYSNDDGTQQDNIDADTDSSDDDKEERGNSSEVVEDEDSSDDDKQAKKVDTEDKTKKIKSVWKRGGESDEEYKPPDSKKSKNVRTPNAKYRQVECNIGNIRTKFQKVPIDRNDLFVSLERYRNSQKFKEAQYKCEKCVQDFLHAEVLKCHMRRHEEAKENPYKCDICETFWETQAMLDMHYKNQHMSQLECLLCGEHFLRRNLLFSHQDEMHIQTYECLECGCKFGDRTAFWRHHRALHTTFQCDSCDKRFHTKNAIIRHLRRKHQTFKCEICNKQLKRWENYLSHKKYRHTESKPSEETYCVECDKYFKNAYVLELHLKFTKIHGGVSQSFPCSECGKEYRREATRNDHYKFVHLKQFDYYCKICDKYFLYKSKLKDHIARIHDKKAKAKNKICQYCGRGFETKAVLVKHIRTHTGERPYACEFCSAAFGQKVAMVIHTRKVHGKTDYMKPTTSQE